MTGKEDESFSRREKAAFSNIDQESKSLVDKLDNRLKFSELIDNLEKEGLGRAMHLTVPAPFASEDDEHDIVKTIGYILPLNVINTRHLVLFKNQKMLIIEPKSPESEEDKEKIMLEYKKDYRPRLTPLRLSHDEYDIDGQVEGVKNFLTGRTKIAGSNEPQDDYPIFNTEAQITKALTASRMLKERKQEKKDTDIKKIIDIYEKEFNTSPPHEAPPAAEPPSV